MLRKAVCFHYGYWKTWKHTEWGSQFSRVSIFQVFQCRWVIEFFALTPLSIRNLSLGSFMGKAGDLLRDIIYLRGCVRFYNVELEGGNFRDVPLKNLGRIFFRGCQVWPTGLTILKIYLSCLLCTVVYLYCSILYTAYCSFWVWIAWGYANTWSTW